MKTAAFIVPGWLHSEWISTVPICIMYIIIIVQRSASFRRLPASVGSSHPNVPRHAAVPTHVLYHVMMIVKMAGTFMRALLAHGSQ